MAGRDPEQTTKTEPAGSTAGEANLEVATRLRDLYEREGPWGVYEHYDEYFQPGATWNPAISDLGTEAYIGREGIRRWIEDMEAVATDFSQTVLEVKAVGDRHVLALSKLRIVGKESGLSFDGDYAGLWGFEDGLLVSVQAFLTHEEAERAALELEKGGGDA